MDKQKLASFLDLANHHQDATPEDIKLLCRNVKKHGFNSAFVNPCFVTLARKFLKDEGKVGTVVSFPLGQDTLDVKIIAAMDAMRAGADELDICMNVGLFKAGDKEQVSEELKTIVETARNLRRAIVIKYIIETGFLTDEEIKEASLMVLASGADFVKTCSGMGPRGARLGDVGLIREAVGKKIRVKVAGGISTLAEVMDFVVAGADRIGTSKAVEIVEERRVIKGTR